MGAHEANEQEACVSRQKGGWAEPVKERGSQAARATAVKSHETTKAKYSIRENHTPRDLLGQFAWQIKEHDA